MYAEKMHADGVHSTGSPRHSEESDCDIVLHRLHSESDPLKRRRAERKGRKLRAERLRRERINTSLTKIREMVCGETSEKDHDGDVSKLEKAQILEETVRYLTEIKAVGRSSLRHKTKQGYQKGFSMAACEAIKYMQGVPDLPDRLKEGLRAHLEQLLHKVTNDAGTSSSDGEEVSIHALVAEDSESRSPCDLPGVSPDSGRERRPVVDPTASTALTPKPEILYQVNSSPPAGVTGRDTSTPLQQQQHQTNVWYHVPVSQTAPAGFYMPNLSPIPHFRSQHASPVFGNAVAALSPQFHQNLPVASAPTSALYYDPRTYPTWALGMRDRIPTYGHGNRSNNDSGFYSSPSLVASPFSYAQDAAARIPNNGHAQSAVGLNLSQKEQRGHALTPPLSRHAHGSGNNCVERQPDLPSKARVLAHDSSDSAASSVGEAFRTPVSLTEDENSRPHSGQSVSIADIEVASIMGSVMKTSHKTAASTPRTGHVQSFPLAESSSAWRPWQKGSGH